MGAERIFADVGDNITTDTNVAFHKLMLCESKFDSPNYSFACSEYYNR
jgi:hypothetical protein